MGEKYFASKISDMGLTYGESMQTYVTKSHPPVDKRINGSLKNCKLLIIIGQIALIIKKKPTLRFTFSKLTKQEQFMLEGLWKAIYAIYSWYREEVLEFWNHAKKGTVTPFHPETPLWETQSKEVKMRKGSHTVK